MKKDLPTTENLPARPLSTLGPVRTKSGIEFDASADIWAFRDDVTDVSLNFSQLTNISDELRESAKRVLSWYAENNSSAHMRNLFQRFQHFIRMTPSQLSSISDVSLLNYRAGLDESTGWYLGTLAGFLRKWIQLGYPGVDEGVDLLLKQLRLKGNRKGIAVLTWDPIDGPFTTNEMEGLHAALNQAYACGSVSEEDYVLAWLYILLGQRNQQYAALKVCDVRVKRNAEGALKYSIHMPRAKKRTKNARAELKERSLLEQFGEILVAYAEGVCKQFEGRLVDPMQAPLFPTKRSAGGTNGFEFHRTALDIGKTITTVLEGLSVVSERTGEVMSITPTRFRRTTGTRAAEEGYSELEIAALLDHSDTQNVQVYTASSPAIIDRIDRVIAMGIAPLAQAFAGKLVDGLGVDTSNRIIDLRVDRSGAPMGDCGKHGFCGFNAPIACYTCSSFEAWVDGPHEGVLAHLLENRDRQLQTTDKRIASINDRTIFAVAAVIRLCEEKKNPAVKASEETKLLPVEASEETKDV
ncbi:MULTISPECIES: site-specific integrase [unclassified Comamonas]|uniref:site-specific integrase n=1 Tax=unclassified Comamonas TaxID=2638500 RepID=UPI001FA6CEDC|nr:MULTISPECIES: site-specific integrase [unclassified Comamonas]UNV90754.1 site-specific integrase [Comamonas sp. 7D-2evo1]UNV95660.1 site-specific integrase [Comamonas sp. 7D-2]UNW00393.1 site-specific integrase [Comamonas sp. 7D-2evo2]